jgi:hypothetical protein
MEEVAEEKLELDGSERLIEAVVFSEGTWVASGQQVGLSRWAV